jgi:RNA ligase
MNYQFPIIRTIDDVLPHIEGRSEFIVAEREGYSVINYTVSMHDTFDMYGPNDHGGAMRRECRGIKFYPTGKIAARFMHKWFNVNEREETQINAIDFSQRHRIEIKEDGSAIHPIKLGKHIRWCTKMGITDVAMQAEKYAAKNSKYIEFARYCIDRGLTPSFEWCSPFNQIVVRYEIDKLVLLCLRDNITGEYIKIY